MSQRNSFLPAFLSLLLVLLFCQACAKSRLLGSWEDPARTGYHMGKVLVIGVFSDPTPQQIYEDSFVSLLQQAGVQAVASHTYDLGTGKPSKQAIASVLEKSGATSVLITHLVREKDKKYHYAPLADYIVSEGYWDSLDGYHDYVYEQVWSPGGTNEDRYQWMEAVLYDAKGGKPIWCARSESVNLQDRLRSDDQQLEQLFVNDLRRKKLL